MNASTKPYKYSENEARYGARFRIHSQAQSIKSPVRVIRKFPRLTEASTSGALIGNPRHRIADQWQAKLDVDRVLAGIEAFDDGKGQRFPWLFWEEARRGQWGQILQKWTPSYLRQGSPTEQSPSFCKNFAAVGRTLWPLCFDALMEWWVG